MKKIIIMGLAESGKTTIIKVAAEGYIPQKKVPYTATIDYKRKTYTLFGTQISVFDLGGQKSFLDRFIGDLAEFIFSNVTVFVFVIDIVNIPKLSMAKYYLDMGLKTLKKYSPQASIHILFHKIDLVDKTKSSDFFNNVKDFLELDDSYNIYKTSVYDGSILPVMEEIITTNVKDEESIESIIQKFEFENRNFIEQILLLDNHKTPVFSTLDENELFILKEKLYGIHQTLETSFTINEPLTLIFQKYKSKAVVIAMLKNYFLLMVRYKAQVSEEYSESTQRLWFQTVKLVNELNKVMK